MIKNAFKKLNFNKNASLKLVKRFVNQYKLIANS